MSVCRASPNRFGDSEAACVHTQPLPASTERASQMVGCEEDREKQAAKRV